MEKVYKIVFTGPVGTGKTTAISSVSDIPIVSTEAKATENYVKEMKQTTTVAMDYGMIKLGESVQVNLYGTPGQERFDFMWDILTQGSLGLIILLNHSSEKSLDELNFFLNKFRDFINKTSLAVGITHVDETENKDISIYYKELKKQEIIAPCFTVDCRNKKDISLLIKALLLDINPLQQI